MLSSISSRPMLRCISTISHMSRPVPTTAARRPVGPPLKTMPGCSAIPCRFVGRMVPRLPHDLLPHRSRLLMNRRFDQLQDRLAPHPPASLPTPARPPRHLVRTVPPVSPTVADIAVTYELGLLHAARLKAMRAVKTACGERRPMARHGHARAAREVEPQPHRPHHLRADVGTLPLAR